MDRFSAQNATYTHIHTHATTTCTASIITDIATTLTQAALLLNLADSATNLTVSAAQLGLPPGMRVRDVWARQDLGAFAHNFTAANVPPNGVSMIVVSREN